MVNVSAGSALTLADADGDGVDDHTVIGCVPDLEEQQPEENIQNNSGENNTVVDDLDADNDGVLDGSTNVLTPKKELQQIHKDVQMSKTRARSTRTLKKIHRVV